MPDYAAVIGSYRLPQFVELNILTLREIWGDLPILVSDDHSELSQATEAVAKKHGVEYICSESRRGHFAADIQSFINGLAFARAHNCDKCIKVSQRFIFLSPDVKAEADRLFANPLTEVLMPGRPDAKMNPNSKFFGVFPNLTDVVFMRASSIEPEWMMDAYRYEVRNQLNKYSALVEFCWNKWVGTRFNGRMEPFNIITNHINDGNQFRYLRRYQNTEAHYASEAAKRGLFTRFPLEEWSVLERQGYLSRPVNA